MRIGCVYGQSSLLLIVVVSRYFTRLSKNNKSYLIYV